MNLLENIREQNGTEKTLGIKRKFRKILQTKKEFGPILKYLCIEIMCIR